MSLFTSKLFNKNKETPTIEEGSSPSAYHLVLYDLLANGQNSKKRRDLEAEIESFDFPTSSYEKELAWIHFYLRVENYLIVFDGRYIGSKKILREEVNANYSHFADLNAFKTLLGNEFYQEVSIAHYFLKYIFHKTSLLVETADRWNFSALLPTEISKSLDRVAYIHTLRKLKDKAHEFYNEMLQYTDSKSLNNIFEVGIANFSTQFQNECDSKILKDFIPSKLFIEETRSIDTNDTQVVLNSSIKASNSAHSVSNDVLEHLLDSYILFNKEGKISQYNSKALQLFGYPEEVFKLMSVFSLFPNEFSAQLKEEVLGTSLTFPKKIIGHRNEIELKVNNQVEEFEIAVTNNYTSPVDTFSVLLKDISHRKETLKSIKEAKKNAERTAEAKSTFLSNMSHEIRTPLNVILGLSEIIKKDKHQDPTMLQKNIEGIDFSARNLLAIVNDILDFSKIEAGKLSIQSLDFNIKKVIGGISNGFDIKAREKGLTFECDIEKNIPEVVIGDQYRLNQILTNLIGNAIKFTSEGQVSIIISKVNESEENVTLSFKVKDTGVGIPDDQLHQIFDSFYQVEGTENAKMKGTGLGLTITKELISLLGGTLEAKSTEGLGSIFLFEIPFKKSLLQSMDVAKATIKTKDDALKGLRVLVAEDNKMNQFYIKQLLSNLHIEVTLAENGQEAVKKFENESSKYDMILMDMHMPVMDGIDAIRKIRSSWKDKQKKIPIVMCSADVFPEARKNAIKAGIDFYLTKPLSEEAVKEVLHWLVNDNFTPKITSVVNENNQVKEKSVDLQQLKAMFDNDEDFLISLFEIFIQETPEDYNTLRDCMDKEYYPRVAEVAHKMKSSFMNLGMTSHGLHLQHIEKNVTNPAMVEVAKEHFEAFKKGYTKALLEVNLLLLDLKKK